MALTTSRVGLERTLSVGLIKMPRGKGAHRGRKARSEAVRPQSEDEQRVSYGVVRNDGRVLGGYTDRGR